MIRNLHPSCSQSAFERRYRESPDPWHFTTSAYERARYDAIIASLTRRSYRRAFEAACSIGELTARLAPLCQSVIATDFAPSAVARARRRCEALPNVEVVQADLALGPPPGPFDLILLCEVGYYFEESRLVDVTHALARALDAGGELLAAHWLGDSADHVLHGDQVHRLLAAHLELEWIQGTRHPGFRIDSWRRA